MEWDKRDGRSQMNSKPQLLVGFISLVPHKVVLPRSLE